MSFVDACGNDLVEKLFADHWLVMIVSDLSDIFSRLGPVGIYTSIFLLRRNGSASRSFGVGTCAHEGSSQRVNESTRVDYSFVRDKCFGSLARLGGVHVPTRVAVRE